MKHCCEEDKCLNYPYTRFIQKISGCVSRFQQKHKHFVHMFTSFQAVIQFNGDDASAFGGTGVQCRFQGSFMH